MEKTFKETKIEFKDVITMRDYQACSMAYKEYLKTDDEMALAFKMFPIFCLRINGETLSDEAKRKWLEELTDFELFQSITEVIAEIQTKAMQGLDEKKKVQSNMNLTN